MKYKVDDIVRIIDGKGDYRGCYNGEAHRIKRVLDTAGTRYAVVSGGGLDGFWWFGESEIELVKEAVMEKELEFVGLAIDIEILKEKGACDEGLLWFVKKYGKYSKTLEELYHAVPSDTWRAWFKDHFPEYIKEKKPKYCCEEFKKSVDYESSSSYEWACLHNFGDRLSRWSIATKKPKEKPSCS